MQTQTTKAERERDSTSQGTKSKGNTSEKGGESHAGIHYEGNNTLLNKISASVDFNGSIGERAVGGEGSLLPTVQPS